MSINFRFWILAFPDIKKPIGGIKQLHRLCEILLSLDYECFLVQENKSFRPGWFSSEVHSVSRADWLSRTDLSTDRDLIILPETFLPAINTIFPSIRKIIFNQNSSYTFGLPGKPFDIMSSIDFYNRPEVVQVWCISDYDYKFIESCFECPTNRLFRIVNDLGSSDNFSHTRPKKKQIAFMPRKNSRDADIVSCLIRSQATLHSWNIVPIQNCSHREVINILEKSLVYLSFGHPEGFGLPVAEAMACGCAVVGYSGLGGRELFDINSTWNVNFPVEFGDWYGFISGMVAIEDIIMTSPDLFFTRLASHAKTIKKLYNYTRMKNSVALAARNLEIST